MKLTVFLAGLFSAVGLVSSGNILILLPLPLYSHTNTYIPIFEELAARGHNITMVSPFPRKQRMDNWTDIVIDRETLDIYTDAAVQSFIELSVYRLYPAFWSFAARLQELVLQDDAVQRLIKEDNWNFDLMISEPYFAHESLMCLAHKFNVPVVGIYPLTLSAWPSYFTGNQIFSVDIPNYRTDYTNRMNLFQRLDNAFVNILELTTGLFYYFPMQEKLAEKYMVYPGSENRPPLFDILTNVSLLLLDSHYSVGYPRSLQPNVIQVGGLSLKNSGNLPDDLQSYMDNSPNGVVYLSFGSHLQVTSVDEKFLNSLRSAFRSIEVNVLMKWENDTLLDKPDNVEIRKWFPQSSVLAHPKCRAFITHGGIHGLSEAVYHGVPVLVIPFFADQEFNANFAVASGIGYRLLKRDVTEKTLKHAVETVLYTKSYKENAVRRSRISRDRPNTPLDEAVYWVEYVLRHGDVSHLRPAALKLPLYQQLLADLIIVLALLIIIPITFIYVMFKLTIKAFSNKTFTKKKPEQKKSKKQ